MKLRHRFFALACVFSLAFALICYFGVRLIDHPHEDDAVTTVIELPPPLAVTHDAPATTEPETPVVDDMADIAEIYRETDENIRKLDAAFKFHDELVRQTDQSTVALIKQFKELGIFPEKVAELERLHEESKNIHIEPLPPEVVENMDVEHVFRELGLDTSVLELDD